MNKINIQLNNEEIFFLKEFIRKGHKSARALTRANILLLANQNKKSTEIADTLNVHRSTVSRIKKRYIKEGLESALKEKPRPGQPIKYTEKHTAEVIALACTTPPEGRKRWTIELLVEELTKREGFENITRETIRLILKKTKQNHG